MKYDPPLDIFNSTTLTKTAKSNLLAAIKNDII